MPNKAYEISLAGRIYPLKIKDFTNSKSLKLRVVNGYILITKARHISTKEALKFLESNREWLLAKLNEKKENFEDFLKSVEFLYLNEKAYKVILLKDTSANCIINHSKQEVLLSYIDNEDLGEILLAIAKKTLPQKAKNIANGFGIKLEKLSIRSQRTLWGSRSSSGTLSLNWRLILLPEALQFYIICHELAHIKFMDHSTSFWIYLNTLCPKAKSLDRLLAEKSARIFKLSK